MSVVYSIHVLDSPDAPDARAYPEVSGPFVPRRGDTVLIPISGEAEAVCTVTDVFISLEQAGSGQLAHGGTVVEVLRDRALRPTEHRRA